MYGYSPNMNINPYLNAFQPTAYQQQPKQEVVKVNGENGARAYPIGPNSSALLLDESGVMIWLVTSDGAGYKTVSPYDITPHQAAPAPDYNTLEQRITRLEGLINGNTSNSATAWSTGHAVKSDFSTSEKSCSDSKNGEKSGSITAKYDSTEEPTAAASYGLREK